MDFKKIPASSRPVPFWSWNERLDTEETKDQVRKMHEAGIGGFFMHARGGLQTEYMGDEWFDNIAAAVSEAKKLGMHAWAYDENGWPSGFGGGAVNGLGLKYQQKYLRYSEGECDRENTIINKDGFNFYFDVNPFYVDTLDGEVTDRFIEAIYKPYYERFGNDIEGFFTDEPQISRNGIPWSFILPDEYRAAYGEELTDVLIQLFRPVGDYKNTRVKFWKLVTCLFSKNYMKKVYDWCCARGLKFTGHLVCEETFESQLTSNGACMPHYEYFTIPGMDWLGRHNTYSLTNYQLASAARQTGKKQVLSETFALCGHNVSHDELKWIYEFQMVRGVNLLCQHLEGYSNRGIRKRDYPPAMYVQQPWWSDYKIFNDAMSRIGMMLAEGDDCTDVLVIHPQSTAWALFDGAGDREFRRYNDSLLELMQKLEKKHISFHFGDEIMIERHGRVEDGFFIIGEKKYSRVIIPEHEIFFDNTERLLDEFVKSGGVITTADEIEENRVIDIPDITVCKRACGEYDLYYFVNSTSKTFDAEIFVGNKRVDALTGEISDFDGKHTFERFESLVVIDDRCGRAVYRDNKSKQKLLDLSGDWDIESPELVENSLTLDYCDYYFDGVLEEKNGYVLNAMYRALERKKKTRIRLEYTIKVKDIPDSLFVACETPELFDITVNEKLVEHRDCGYFRDKAFRKLDIKEHVTVGENKIVFETDFDQSERVYRHLADSMIFESVKNCLTFDMEIEQIYLVGAFSVRTDGVFTRLENDAHRYVGDFVIEAPRKSVTLDNLIKEGFPGFSGELAVRRSFDYHGGGLGIDFAKKGINAVRISVNGKYIRTVMFEPYYTDISEYLTDGENTVELVLVNNLRNMQGPLHLTVGEAYSVGPASFFKEPCVWFRKNNSWASGGTGDDRWNDDYCFCDVTLTNK